ncbi:MAG TPA: hypothetical protein VL899_05950 [Alphaproteobacteria bacterium]|nr:hypothetical protein [Alphaproteobacteria bacterium]
MSDEQDEKAQKLARFRANLAKARQNGNQPVAKARLKPALRSVGRPPQVFQPTEWPAIPQAAQMLIDWRRERRRKFLLRLGLFCGLPTLLTFFYMVFIASPRFVSEFEMTYQIYQPPSSLAAGVVQNYLGGNAGSTVDLSTILYEYIRSGTMLNKLDEQMKVRDYYSSKDVDFLSRMSRHASASKFLRYYLWYVSVSQNQGGYLTVDVQAFDPDYAQKLGQAIAKAADEMVDSMSEQARKNEVAYAEAEVRKGEERLTKARLALTDFQNAHRDINPQGTASQFSGIVGQLESQLTAARSHLILLNGMAPKSPDVTATQHQIDALVQQLKIERERLATSAGGTPYSKLLNDYSALQFEEQFAQTALSAAQQGLELAHADAARRQNYLINFAPPSRPESQKWDFALTYTATIFVVSLALFGIGSLLFGAMRDQAGV